MRDTLRIVRICNKIARLWRKTPDMRFFQFISWLQSTIVSRGGDLDFFYYEDDELEFTLNQLLKES